MKAIGLVYIWTTCLYTGTGQKYIQYTQMLNKNKKVKNMTLTKYYCIEGNVQVHINDLLWHLKGFPTTDIKESFSNL